MGKKKAKKEELYKAVGELRDVVMGIEDEVNQMKTFIGDHEARLETVENRQVPEEVHG